MKSLTTLGFALAASTWAAADAPEAAPEFTRAFTPATLPPLSLFLADDPPITATSRNVAATPVPIPIMQPFERARVPRGSWPTPADMPIVAPPAGSIDRMPMIPPDPTMHFKLRITEPHARDQP